VAVGTIERRQKNLSAKKGSAKKKRVAKKASKSKIINKGKKQKSS
jgi:hypothetical protein